jgi:NAD(P)H-dependent FMN reductase
MTSAPELLQTREELRSSMIRVAIIVGTTRPGRRAETLARWFYDLARSRDDLELEIVDMADFDLPLRDEPIPLAMGQYSKPHTNAWAAQIASFDAFFFVAPDHPANSNFSEM